MFRLQRWIASRSKERLQIRYIFLWTDEFFPVQKNFPNRQYSLFIIFWMTFAIFSQMMRWLLSHFIVPSALYRWVCIYFIWESSTYTYIDIAHEAHLTYFIRCIMMHDAYTSQNHAERQLLRMFLLSFFFLVSRFMQWFFHLTSIFRWMSAPNLDA